MSRQLSFVGAAITVGLLHVIETTALSIPVQMAPARVSSASLSMVSTSTSSVNVKYTNSSWDISSSYDEVNCTSVPWFVIASTGCWYSTGSSSDAETCSLNDFGDDGSLADQVPAKYESSLCSSDLASYLEETFSDQVYVRLDFYNTSTCTDSTFIVSNTMIVDGLCHAGFVVDNATEEIIISARLTTLNANGSVSIREFLTGDCSGEPVWFDTIPRELLATNECYNYIRGYTNADLGDADTGGESGEDSVADGDGGSDDASSLAAGSLAVAAVFTAVLGVM
jgi:hypothetical protein